MRVIRRKQRGDEGAALVEFALIAPILFLLLFGLIDFGFIYNDFLQLRQGVRDGARQGAVANFGSDSTCSGLSTSSTSTQAKELLCATRNRIGLDSSKMKTAICVATTTGTCSNSVSDYVDGRTLVVCGMYPATSRSGFLKPFLGSGAVTTRVAIRIEQTSNEISGSPTPNTDDLVSAQETPLTGKDWGFCVP